MKDSQGNLVLGRTRWRLFAALVVPASIVVIALTSGIASGAVAIKVTISGQVAMMSADKLDAQGFHQWGGTVIRKKDGQEIPVAYSAIRTADITNLCQSVKLPGTPVVLKITGGDKPGAPVHAEGLLIALDYLAGDAEFTNIAIGTDASDLSKGGPTKGEVGGFGQEADTAVITGLNQRFYYTFAAKFQLRGMKLAIHTDGKECFSMPTPS